MTKEVRSELVDSDANIGTLIGEYRQHIKSAYSVSKKLKQLGIERPWISVVEKEPIQNTIVDCLKVFKEGEDIKPIPLVDVEKKIRLEIR